MKNFKIILLVYSSLFFSTIAFAQSITVDDPHRGDSWCKTQTYTIRWTKSGTIHNKVKIRLYNTAGTVKILNISDDTENDENFSWKIPDSVTPGNYLVRVKTLDNAVYDDSDVFTISAEKPVIFVYNPKKGEELCRGQKSAIFWARSKAGSMDDKVKIRLYQRGNLILRITDSTANATIQRSASYWWTIPESVNTGKYTIRVKTLDNTVFDDSEEFTIKNCSQERYPDFFVERFYQEGPYNYHHLKAIIRNRGKSYSGPLEIKMIGMDKFFGKRMYSLNKTVTIQKIILDSGNSWGVSLPSIGWPVVGVPYITFQVQIDPKNKILEMNENNNFSRQLTILRKYTTKPDFVLLEVKYSRGKLTAVIINEGAFFNGPLDFRIVGIDKLSGGRFTLDKRITRYVSNLYTGYKQIVQLYDIDWPQGVQNIAFAVQIDPDNKIIELKEDNNFKEQLINKR